MDFKFEDRPDVIWRETACVGYAASCLRQRNQGSRFILQSQYYYTDIDIINYVNFNNHPRGREKRGRQEKGDTACLFCLAPSVICVLIFASRAFSLDGLRKNRDCRQCTTKQQFMCFSLWNTISSHPPLSLFDSLRWLSHFFVNNFFSCLKFKRFFSISSFAALTRSVTEQASV